MQAEILKKKMGGARPGAGRPKGRLDNKTIQREFEQREVKKQFDQRVLRLTNSLINAQATLALGQTFLFKIEKEWVKTGEKKNGEENGYWKNKKPVQVQGEDEIVSYLENLADKANGDVEDRNDPSETYYYLTAKEPNNMAIDSLHNRVHGKPRESLELSGNVKFSLLDLAKRRKEIEATREAELVEPKLIEGNATDVSPA